MGIGWKLHWFYQLAYPTVQNNNSIVLCCIIINKYHYDRERSQGWYNGTHYILYGGVGYPAGSSILSPLFLLFLSNNITSDNPQHLSDMWAFSVGTEKWTLLSGNVFGTSEPETPGNQVI